MNPFKINNDRKALGYLVMSSACVVFYYFHKMILAPNAWILGHQGGDGMKNYFTVLHYVKYDKDLLFSGMNYPYGEYIHFIDAHPIIAVLLNFIDDRIISISDYMPAILNYWILLGLIITPIVIYYLLRHFSLPRSYSIAVALIISFLSPQLERMSSHYALSYSYIIPLGWLLLLKIYASKKPRYDLGFYLSLLIVISSWIHAYFAAIIAMFVFACGIYLYLFTGRKKILPIITPLVALGISYFLLSITDQYVDRETFPWGVYQYTSYLESLFLPDRGLLHELLNKAINVRDVPWEGRAFVGLLGIPIFILILFSGIKRLLTSKPPYAIIRNKALVGSFFASIIVWIYSTAWVHSILPEFFQRTIKPLYQFRSMGRFAWVFYFVFTVCMAYIIYRLYRKYRPEFPAWSKVALITALGIWTFDAYNKSDSLFVNAIHKNELLLPGDQTFEQILSRHGYSINNFQASIPLPLTIIDTKFLWFQHQEWYFRYAMQVAYSDGLPIIGSYAGRPSIHHSTALRQLYSPPWIKKNMADHFDERPFLIIKGKEKRKYAYEDSLLAHCTLIADTKKFTLMELPRSYFDYNIYDPALLYNSDSLSNLIPALHENRTITLPDGSPFISHSYDDLLSDHSLVGSALKIELNNNKTKEIEFDVSGFRKKETVEISFWYYIDHTVIDVPKMDLLQKDKSKKVIATKPLNWRVKNTIIGQWVRVDETLELNVITDYLALNFKVGDCVIDEVLIRPKNVDVLSKRNGQLMVNNYPLDQ